MEAPSYQTSSTGPLTVALQVRVVRGFAGRLCGLIGRASPAPGCGLLLPGVRAVHGLGMRDAIDVLFLDARGCIVRVASLTPARFVACAAARHVLEMRSGEVERLGLHQAMRPPLLLLDDIFDEGGVADPSHRVSADCRIRRQGGVRRVVLVLGLLLTAVVAAGHVQAAPPGELDTAVVFAPRSGRVTTTGVRAPASGGTSGGTSGSPAMPAGTGGGGNAALSVRPVSIEALQRVEEEAEIIYRENRRESDEALVEVYQALAELAPDRFPRAWLRIGNIRQRAGRLGEAADAYRRVRAPAEERKALLNLTALTLEEARQALARLDALPAAASTAAGAESAPSLPAAREEHAVVTDLQRQLQAAEQNLVERQRRRSDTALAERDSAAGMHMIERYTASARRNAVKAARGTLHVDPADEMPARPVPPPRSRSAAESLPSVEYLLGDPLRSRQNVAEERDVATAASAAGIKGGTAKASAPSAPASTSASASASASAPGDWRDRDAGRSVSAGAVGGRAADAGRGGLQK